MPARERCAPKSETKEGSRGWGGCTQAPCNSTQQDMGLVLLWSNGLGGSGLMKSQAGGRRDGPGARGEDGQGEEREKQWLPFHGHRDAWFRGMSGDEAVNLVCIASRSKHSTFITPLTVVQ